MGRAGRSPPLRYYYYYYYYYYYWHSYRCCSRCQGRGRRCRWCWRDPDPRGASPGGRGLVSKQRSSGGVQREPKDRTWSLCGEQSQTATCPSSLPTTSSCGDGPRRRCSRPCPDPAAAAVAAAVAGAVADRSRPFRCCRCCCCCCCCAVVPTNASREVARALSPPPPRRPRRRRARHHPRRRRAPRWPPTPSGASWQQPRCLPRASSRRHSRAAPRRLKHGLQVEALGLGDLRRRGV